jgi:hypothetical protein
MLYLERRPGRPLFPAVRALWTFDSGPWDPAAEPTRIVPDGCVELILHLGTPYAETLGNALTAQPRALVTGQITGPLVLVPQGAALVVGVRLAPWAAGPMLGLPMHELADTHAEAAGLRRGARASRASLGRPVGGGPAGRRRTGSANPARGRARAAIRSPSPSMRSSAPKGASRWTGSRPSPASPPALWNGASSQPSAFPRGSSHRSGGFAASSTASSEARRRAETRPWPRATSIKPTCCGTSGGSRASLRATSSRLSKAFRPRSWATLTDSYRLESVRCHIPSTEVPQ